LEISALAYIIAIGMPVSRKEEKIRKKIINYMKLNIITAIEWNSEKKVRSGR
jgi:hypothetical protein